MFTSSTLLEWHLLYKSCTQEHTLRTHFSTAAHIDSPLYHHSLPAMDYSLTSFSIISPLSPFLTPLSFTLHVALYLSPFRHLNLSCLNLFYYHWYSPFLYLLSLTFSLFVALWPDMSVPQQRAPLYQSAPATNTECITGVILYPPTLKGGGMQMSTASASMTKEQITEHAQHFLKAYRWVWLQLLCFCVTMPCVNVQSCSKCINKDGCHVQIKKKRKLIHTFLYILACLTLCYRM